MDAVLNKMLMIGLMLGMVGIANVARAEPVMNAERQSCQSDADCTFVSLTCGNPCASVPISMAGKEALEPRIRQECGGTLPEESNITCTMHPPLQAACVNQRCTVGYAFEKHGGLNDYQTSQAPQSAAANP